MTGDGDRARPWWASLPDVTALDAEADPLVRHREARRGADPAGATRPAPAWWSAAADAIDRLGEDLADGAVANAAAASHRDDDPAAPPSWERPTVDATGARDDGDDGRSGADDRDDRDDRDGPRPGAHGPDVCGVCPVCLVVRAVAETRPELAAHLLEAGRQLSLAVRTLVDGGRDRPRAPRHPRPGAGEDPDPGDHAPRRPPPDRAPLTRIDLDQDGP